jgi:hypothetical protein
MQNNGIMSEPSELKLLDGRYNSSDVISLSKNTETKNEDRIDWVDLGKTMVAAFIGIYDVIAKLLIHGPISKNPRV